MHLVRFVPGPRGQNLLILLAVLAAGCGDISTEKNIELSRTHYLLGEDFLKKKKPLQGKQELLKAVKRDPENRLAYHLLGFVAFMEGLRSLNYVDRVQCLQGVEAEEQRKLASADFKRSEKYLIRSVKMAKKENKVESEALLWLANIAIHFKRHDDAIKYVSSGLENSYYPSRHLLHGVRGWALFQKGEYRKAGEELRQAIYNQAKFCLGHYRLAKVHFARKQYDKALKELAWTAKEKCPIQEAPYLLGRAYAQKRSMEQARKEFERCVKMNPKSCLSKVCRRLAKQATRGAQQVAK